MHKKIIKVLENPSLAINILFATIRGYYYKIKFKITKPNSVVIGKRFRVYTKIKIEGPGKVIIGNNLSVDRTASKIPSIITHSKNATIIIGNDNYFGGTQISCVNHISIGSEILMANATIIDSFILPSPGLKITDEWLLKYSAPISIGNHCWLGLNSIVLKGVELGDESVLSAGSVVYQSSLPYSLLIGNPARRVGKTRVIE